MFKKILLFVAGLTFLFSSIYALDLSRVKTWDSGDILTHTDLNAEFDNILNHAITYTDLSATAAIPGSMLNLAVPGAIGGTTPSTGAFTNLTTSGTVTFVSGATTLSFPAVTGTVLASGRTNTNSSQPAFLVTPTGNQNDIAINSSVTVAFGTEVFDQNNNFASNTFTAPVTGKYLLSCSIQVYNIDTSASTYAVYIVTSNRNHLQILDPTKYSADIPSGFCFSMSVITDMEATDTAHVMIYQTGGTQQSDIVGGENSFFSGALLF